MSVENDQVFRVSICAFHPETSPFFDKSFPFFSYFCVVCDIFIPFYTKYNCNMLFFKQKLVLNILYSKLTYVALKILAFALFNSFELVL